ncbi:MAG: choice-of-anchor V domain-containing protein [Bacteroidia bacterium]|jgi:hypothetical protein
MKKNYKYLFILPVFLGAIFLSENAFSLLTNFSSVNRAGDPVGPGLSSSKNCTGCHSGIALVTNNQVSRQFTFGANETSYIPGNTYTIKFKIVTGGSVGFSSTVLRNDSNTMAGTWSVLDTAETKIFPHLASGRFYMNHRVGTTTGGFKEYQFKWTAPAQGTGPVTFYFGSLTSNDDQSSSGDTTFLNSYVIAEGSTTGIPTINGSANCRIYPNPVQEKLNLSFVQTENSNVSVSLIALDGKQQWILFNEAKAAGTHHLSFNLAGLVQPGIYFLRLEGSGINHIQKVLVY